MIEKRANARLFLLLFLSWIINIAKVKENNLNGRSGQIELGASRQQLEMPLTFEEDYNKDREDHVAETAYFSAAPRKPKNSLEAMAAMRLLYFVKGEDLKDGIQFMRNADIAPDRLTITMAQDDCFVVSFSLKCTSTPFVARYSSLALLLKSLRCIFPWEIRLVEFFNVAFDIRDVPNLEIVIKGLEPELVLLRNCTYPDVFPGPEAVRFLNAINRQKKTIVCEYGEDRLKSRISIGNEQQPQLNEEEIRNKMPATVPRTAPKNTPYYLVDHEIEIVDVENEPGPSTKKRRRTK
ncbi:unnamed protein product, partial [Mesorhabditis belari]|uniref:Uncharacterized protein n=1 Tax=Mesorhabditis belari TaxID=2138241 RepID=A0AAF3FLI6_9BILA